VLPLLPIARPASDDREAAVFPWRLDTRADAGCRRVGQAIKNRNPETVSPFIEQRIQSNQRAGASALTGRAIISASVLGLLRACARWGTETARKVLSEPVRGRSASRQCETGL